VYILYNNRRKIYELFIDNDTAFLQCVVARYNEDTSWFEQQPIQPFNIICYNKGPQLPQHCMTERCTIKTLPNVGRCDHTYLHHIIENYDSLAPVTLFLPASCMDSHKKWFTLQVIERLLKTKNTVLQGGILNDVRDDLYNFTLDEWKASNPKNLAINPENKLIPSPIRPFGKWYDTHFRDVHVKVFCYYGIIAVAREHIIQHPKSKYQKLIKYLETDSNPEAGHYMERSWGALFYPYPDSCVYSADREQ
jgi:hypothetical protein